MEEKALLLNADDLRRTYRRLAHQIMEPYDDPAPVAIIGMQTRGVYIAKYLRDIIEEDFNQSVPLGILDITFYRDDFRQREKIPTVQVTEIPFDVNNKHIILVDDVLYTGRTVRSAMDGIMSFGRASSIRFCCLIDRGLRELPIRADYIGEFVPTNANEEVRVKVEELDGEDAVYLVETSGEESQA